MKATIVPELVSCELTSERDDALAVVRISATASWVPVVVLGEIPSSANISSESSS